MIAGYTQDSAALAEAARQKALASGLPPPDENNPHNRNHQAQFWRNPNSAHTDWLHGDIATGSDWGVPAIGM